MAKDPTVAARVQEAELHPFKTGLVRGEAGRRLTAIVGGRGC
jgi:hypothetical protein